MDKKQQRTLIILLIVIGLLTRLFPHSPNFTPVLAIALFAGAKLNHKYALYFPITIMIISDLFIGLHDVILFTWGAILLTTFIGTRIRNNHSITNITGASIGSALLFFIVTNFGVWFMGKWYPHTLFGLLETFVMGIPFFRNTLASSLFYSGVFFGIYEFLIRIAKTKTAKETSF